MRRARSPHDAGGNPTANNGQVVASNTNPVDYQGARLSALWKINDNWDLLLQQNYQNMEADGYFYAYPIGTDGDGAQQIPAHRVHARLQQGPVLEHRLDR